MVKKSNVNLTPSSSQGIWNEILGFVAFLYVVAAPYFPDEKLVRPKMAFLEYGVCFLLAFIVARILLTSSESLWHRKEARPAVLAVGLWVGIFIIMSFLAAEWSLAERELRRIFLAGFTFLTFAFLGLEAKWERRLLLGWSWSSGIISLYGCMQVTGGMGPISVPQMDRIMATYGNPIFFAAFLVPSIFVTWGNIQREKQPGLKFGLWVSGMLQGVALYYTQTRAAWIAFAVALFVGLLLKIKNRSHWKLHVLVFGFLVFGFAWGTQSIWKRDQGHRLIWRDTLRLCREHPIKGVGLGAFHTHFPAFAQEDLKSKWPQGQVIINYAHNEYLQIFAEAGVFGLISFLLIPWILLKQKKSWEDPTAISLSLGIVALLVQNFFSADMRFGVSLATYFLLTGLLTAHRPNSEERWVAFVHPLPKLFCWVGVIFWVAFLGFVVVPQIRRPYAAQKEVSAMPGFFDERLLDPAKTLDDLEKLARDYPGEISVLEKLAYVYAKEIKTPDEKINEGMVERALSTYEQILRIKPDYVNAINNMANINYTVGRQEEAIRLWRNCVQIDDSVMVAHLNLGKTLYARGELKESAAHFEKVLKIQPGNSEAIVYLKRMVE